MELRSEEAYMIAAQIGMYTPFVKAPIVDRVGSGACEALILVESILAGPALQ